MLSLVALSVIASIAVAADEETPSVPIDPPDVVGITLTSAPIKTQYLVGEKLDMSGAKLELVYDTGAKGSNIVMVDWCTGFDSSKTGKCTVTVTYPNTSCTDTFEVEVVSVKGIKIESLPNKVTYFVGDREETAGLSVSLQYSNGSSSLLESGYTVSGFDSKTPGEKKITVKYGDFTADYSVKVFEPALQKIEITKKPNKISYYIGEKLDLNGIKVVATYENGKTADVTTKITVNGDVSTSGIKKIEVIYSERDFIKSTSFEVTVTDIQVKHIEFVTYPKKMVYAEKEIFDPAGASIRVTYNNGESAIVSEGLLFMDFSSETIGEKTVTLHYGGYQLNLTVTVVVSDSHVHTESEYKRIKSPTCTEEGIEVTTCLVCGDNVSERRLPALGHGQESMPVQTKAPTCTEAGQTTTYCMVCGGPVTVSDIFPLGHNEGELKVTLDPTCTAEGTSQTACKVCGVTVTINKIPALGHTFGDWTLKLEPTGEAEGSKERICVVCSFAESEAIEKLQPSLSSGNYTAEIKTSGVYFPYLSTFTGELITEKLTADELAALLPETGNGKSYSVLDVWDFLFVGNDGSAINVEADILYSFVYSLPSSEYASFLIFDAELGMYTPVAEGDKISFTSAKSGRFVLVGEQIPEQTTSEETTSESTPPETTMTQESTEESTSSDTVATKPDGKGNKAIIFALVIASMILLLIMGMVIYYYVSNRYY